MLADYPVIVDFPLRWGDMDMHGHLTNTVYLELFDSARVPYLERIGLEIPGLGSSEDGVILAANSCRYLAPVVYPDTLSVGTRVSALGRNRVLFEHAASSVRLGKLVATGEALLVFYDYAESRTNPISAERRAAIIALEEREPPPLPTDPDRGRSSPV